MRNLIIAIIAAAILITAATLSLGGRLRPMANRFENILARPMKLKAPGGAYDTTDHFLKPLEIPLPSETLSKAMAELPPGEAVIFITAGEDGDSELIYRTVSYLSWPRWIGEVRCGRTREATQELFLPPAAEPVKWLMFFRIAPPPDLPEAAKKIGPYLTLTPASESKEWKSYCSR